MGQLSRSSSLFRFPGVVIAGGGAALTWLSVSAFAASGLRGAAGGELPVVLRVSDAVRPGQAFSVTGEGIAAEGLKIAVARSQGADASAQPPAGALYPEILQWDKDAHFAVARMPEQSPAGVYDVWVKTAQGWSLPRGMNAARPLFMSEHQAFKGLEIQLVGRNFDPREFSWKAATLVRLNDGRGRICATSVKELNPYCVTFSISDQPLGDYFVEISNDNGMTWARLDNGQKLSIVARGPDPLNLGVAWAKDFRWDNVVDVTAYGANPNDRESDTIAVQKAIDAAEQSGGGVVHFPKGDYYIDDLNLGAGVVLRGEDQFKTRLLYTASDGRIFVNTKGTGSLGGVARLQGIARLTITQARPDQIENRPDCFIWLGDPWGEIRNQDARVADRIFITQVNLDYPLSFGDAEPKRKHRGMGFHTIARERVLLSNNRFAGWQADHSFSIVNQYFVDKNNYYEYSAGYVQTYAKFSFVENNRIIIHPQRNQDSHGVFTRSDAYVANNYVEGAGDRSNTIGGKGKHNDGEGIAADTASSGHVTFGRISRVEGQTIKVAPIRPFKAPTLGYGDLSVVITHGRGMGQLRKVASLDIASSTIKLEKPFEVIPDESSKFTLIAPLKNCTFYRNTIKNCAKGLWAFGNTYDDVIADNTSIDSQGIYLWTVRGTWGYDEPGYFLRVARNRIQGVSRRDNFAGISVYTARTGSPSFFDVLAYGTEIRDNIIIGDPTRPTGDTRTESPPYSGICVISYGFSNSSDGSGTGDATHTIIEGNRLSNLKTGITVSRCNYGQVISNNSYDASVLRFFEDQAPGSDQTTLIGNVLTTAPVSGSDPE